VSDDVTSTSIEMIEKMLQLLIHVLMANDEHGTKAERERERKKETERGREKEREREGGRKREGERERRTRAIKD
jgi:hypothetical protein